MRLEIIRTPEHDLHLGTGRTLGIGENSVEKSSREEFV